MAPLGVMICGACLLAGCAGTFTATDGTTFPCHRVETYGVETTSRTFCADKPADPIMSALTASAAHDLPCTSDELDVAHLSGDNYAGTGCGWRVVYHLADSGHVVLISRSPLTPRGEQPAPSRRGQPPPPALTEIPR